MDRWSGTCILSLEATSLPLPVSGRPCILDTDAFDVAVGAPCSPVPSRWWCWKSQRPIAFYSRIMNSDQRNYCLTRRELLAVTAALQHFRHYLLCTHVTLRTGHHSLKWLKTFKRPEGSRRLQISTMRSNIDLVDFTAMLMASRGLSANNAGAKKTSQRHGLMNSKVRMNLELLSKCTPYMFPLKSPPRNLVSCNERTQLSLFSLTS